MNPNYEAYAAYNGNTPGEQLESDKKQFPGGKMSGFIAWMLEHSAEYAGVFPDKVTPKGGIIDLKHWTKYLKGIQNGNQ